MTIDFVERKAPDFGRVEELLAVSARKNRWANRGPLYTMLAEQLASHVGLSKNLAFVPTANGGVALEAMARLHAQRAGRQLRWVVSAYSFQNIGRGYFRDAIIVDCDRDGVLDLDACQALNPESFDGLIVTNPFGLYEDFSKHQSFALKLGKPLLIDNAAGLHSRIPDLPWQAFSLHHTKPYGTGEGGMALVPLRAAEPLYELIDYASDQAGSPHWLGNGKISDISCAFHIDRLERSGEWAPSYLQQRERVIELATRAGYVPLSRPQSTIPMTSVPLVAPVPVSEDAIHGSRHMTLAKYYKPLKDLAVVHSLFTRLVNVPCHPDVATLTDAQIVEDLDTLLEALDGKSARSGY